MRVLLLCLALVLPGCQLFGTVEPIGTSAPSTLPEAGKLAQASINEANLGLTAAANVITQNVKDGIWTKEQGRVYVEKIKDYAKQVDRAQELVRLGDFARGKTQAEAVKALIVILHREAAAAARKTQ